MGLKLEVGKYYRDVNGEKRGPMREDPGFDGLIWDEGDDERGDAYHWYVDGKVGAGARSAVELIAEWTDAYTGPIRTVTTVRKELVNGKFGIVHLSGHDTGFAQIKLEAGDQLKSWFSAAELRAAIATLTEIANALEDL